MNKETRILSLNNTDAIKEAAAVIQEGGVIAFPTDTVYGIGVSAFNGAAIDKIYEVKVRSQLKAIPILIGDEDGLEQITSPISSRVRKIIANFWPGALTLVMPLSPKMPRNLSPTPTIGLRLPDHDLARRLLRAVRSLAATSANLSGEASALTAEEVFQQLAGRVDLILDGGPVPGGQASTVLDCSGDDLKILREGPVSLSAIQRVLDERD